MKEKKMFSKSLGKTLSKVTGFINEIKIGIEENEKSIKANDIAINNIVADSDFKINEIKQANKLMQILNG